MNDEINAAYERNADMMTADAFAAQIEKTEADCASGDYRVACAARALLPVLLVCARVALAQSPAPAPAPAPVT